MESTQIKFVRNQPYTFVVTKKFSIGALGGAPGVDVTPGEELDYDGTTVTIGGQQITSPQLRGTIKAGWLVLAEHYNPDAQVSVPSANISVRAAIGDNPHGGGGPAVRRLITTTESDERVVMQRSERAAAAKARTAAARGGSVEEGGAEYGTIVPRSFKTQASSVTEVTPSSVGQAIMAADKVKIDPGEGVTVEDVLSVMTPEEQEEYLSKKEARRIEKGIPLEDTKPVRRAPAQAPQYNTPRTQVRDGITSTLSTRGSEEIYDPTGSGGRAVQSSFESEGIRFTNTNGPRRNNPVPAPALTPQVGHSMFDENTSKFERDGTADVRRMTAKAICPDFPDNYNFNDHWKRRLATILLHHENNRQVLLAIFAAESDDFKKVLLEEFPEAFQSK